MTSATAESRMAVADFFVFAKSTFFIFLSNNLIISVYKIGFIVVGSVY